jgi:hypothetical protein
MTPTNFVYDKIQIQKKIIHVGYHFSSIVRNIVNG